MRFLKTGILCVLIMMLLPYEVMSVGNKEFIKGMKVHFIDVGQGDSTLIETPANKVILIDGGPPEAGDDLLAYLKKKHIKKIDLLIATHPDIDHIGGLVPVIKKLKISKVLDSGKLHSTKTYRDYLRAIRQKKIPFEIAQQDDYIQLDSKLVIQVLNAFDRDKKDNNEASIVLKMSHGTVRFLLMADAEIEQEKEIMKQYDLEADILKIGHHGSNTSTSRAFVEAVQPNTAILTYSKENKFGHPVSRVIRNLNRQEVGIYSTEIFGDTVIWSSGHFYYIMPSKNPMDFLRREND